MKNAALLLGTLAAVSAPAQGMWQETRRGSWLREGAAQRGDVRLVATVNDSVAVVLPPNAPSNLQKAGELFASDLLRLGARRAPIVRQPPPRGARVLVRVTPDAARSEAYTIHTDARGLVIIGSDARGAAFGLYELSERLGVDPLYIWTGLAPERRVPLIVKATRHAQAPPVVRWRGLFHDDEDILPLPIQPNDIPFGYGTVPKVWYERFFETALRLRMNMVAPWVRVERSFEIQKMASDWGLAYTSHHYDVLLSDPFHFPRGLAEKRGVTPKWDWIGNREGLIRYWKAGVDENKELDAIYPIGLRGTNDYGYPFPREWSEERRIAAYNEALATQARLVDEGLPKGKPRRMHFTMYTEMLPYYQTGKLKVPDGTIIVWPDDNDGNMRGLPPMDAPGPHGVYYHLAYLGGDLTKQTHQVVPLPRIEREFRKILDAKATDYILTNVSEIREYVMGIRFINDVMWEGDRAFDKPDAAGRYLAWWSREYFSEAAAPLAAAAIDAYFASVTRPEHLWQSAQTVLGAIGSLRLKLKGETFYPARGETRPRVQERHAVALDLQKRLEAARAVITDPQQRRFFEENVELPAAIDRLNSEAALILLEAMEAPNRRTTLDLCRAAMRPLDDLSAILRRAERPPFERWYGPTSVWQRSHAVSRTRTELVSLLQEAGN